jgi:hypothetical protein
MSNLVEIGESVAGSKTEKTVQRCRSENYPLQIFQELCPEDLGEVETPRGTDSGVSTCSQRLSWSPSARGPASSTTLSACLRYW